MSESIFLIAVVSVWYGVILGAVRSTRTPNEELSWRKQPPLLRIPGVGQ